MKRIVLIAFCTASIAFLLGWFSGSHYEASLLNNQMMSFTDELRLQSEQLSKQYHTITETNALLIGNFGIVSELRNELKADIDYFSLHP